MQSKNLLIILYLMALFSCKKEKQEFTDSPVIEAYLEPGNVIKVNITHQIPFSEDVKYSDDDINNLRVNVEVKGENHLLKPMGNGGYADSSMLISEGTLFNLSFNFNNRNVTAYTTIPSKPLNFSESVTTYTITRQDTTVKFGSGGFTQPDPLLLAWANSDNSYYLVVIENLETTLDPIRSFGNNTRPGNRFRKTPTNSSGIQIQAREFQYYGTHRIILYHVLPDYTTLYNANSSSSQNLTNPSTSIVNGYGIFTGLNSDTLYLEVKTP